MAAPTNNSIDKKDQALQLQLQNHTKSETSETDGFDLWHEGRMLLHIALPSVCVQFNMYFLFPLAASSVGLTLGTDALAGFSLGSLLGNLTCVSVIIGALGAADTLMPRAYSSERYAEVGRLAVRAVSICILLLVPPMILLYTATDWILVQLGQDPRAASLAATWIKIYLLGIPANLIFRVSQRFMIAQHKPWPPVYASVIPSFVLQPILLRVLMPLYGFEGSAMAVVISQWAMIGSLFLYLHMRPEHHPETWPGLSLQFWKDCFLPEPLLRFFSLSLGGVVSLSEWWFWETMCFIAGTFGVVSLCVHSIAYQLIPLLYMIPLGIGLGLTVRMGSVLATDSGRAKQMATWCLAFVSLLGVLVSLLLFQLRWPIIRMFTKDPEVIHGCLEIWGKVSFYIFIIFIYHNNSAIMRALGMQWAMAVVVFACLWFGTLPAIVYFAMFRGGRLPAQWTVLPLGYVVMQVILVMSYVLVNWEIIGHGVRQSIARAISESARKNLQQVDTLQPQSPATLATEETPLMP